MMTARLDEFFDQTGIIVAGRVVECVRFSRDVPIVIQELADAKADRQPALDRFEDALEDIRWRCLEGR